MNRFTRLQKRLITIAAIIFIIGCLMLGLRQPPLSNAGYSIWTYIRFGLIDYPITSLTHAFSDVSNLWQVYQDNEYLNEQLASQRSYQTLYQDEKNRNLELEQMLDLKSSLPDAEKITCQVIERSPSTWEKTFTISAGNAQGVRENMIVVSSDGAVGLVSEVQTASSTVTLLTSPHLANDIAISIALTDGTTIEGVLQSYDASRRAYRVSLFDNEAVITSGQAVSTSGKGGNYPSGIFVGTVTESVVNDDAIISTVYVRPVADMNSFNYVTVIGRKDS